MEDLVLSVRPIGFIRTQKILKFETPHQPNPEDNSEMNQIEFLPGRNYELALQDLASFSHVWLVSWFHKNQNWRPRVLPPRGPAVRRGVFATRSPHRPNPIGLTCVRLLAVEKLTLTIGALDLTDGTPILDIKPYLRTVDAPLNPSLGWLQSVEDEESSPAEFTILEHPTAAQQLDWLDRNGHESVRIKLQSNLTKAPFAHRTRRILKLKDGTFRMACGPWRVFFSVVDTVVHIFDVGTAYQVEELKARSDEPIKNMADQYEFLLWKSSLS